MKKTLTAFYLILILVFITACTGNSSVSDDSEGNSVVSETTSSTLSNLSDSATSSEGHTSEESNIEYTNIYFIGNSLTYVGEIPEKITMMVKQEEKAVKVFEKTSGGYTLYQHLCELRSDAYKNLVAKADIVVLQEYGTLGNNTAVSVTEIQKLFKEGTKFYFLLTEFDVGGRLEELKDVENITYIPSGYVHDLLLTKGFTYEQLHIENDYHPNSLYGYVAALTVFSKVFETDCIGMPYDFLNNSTVALIPGRTQEQKSESITLIQEAVMEIIETDLSELN